MEKDFEGWSERKRLLNSNTNKKFYTERELWWAALGVNVGFEQDGVGKDWERPILILKGLSPDTFFAVPLTTSISTHPMRLSIGLVQGKEASALLSQLRTMDTKRLLEKIGFLEKEKFSEVKNTLKAML